MIPKETVVAIAGNPNAGKTTVFNALTGSHQHTGNWPGVTVEKKYGFYSHGGKSIRVVDLPGTYGFSARSIDEKIARDYLLSRKADVVVIVADATLLERHLYLTALCLEMELKVILCLNMMDLATEQGITIDHEALSKVLGVPVIPCVAVSGEGIEGIKDAIASHDAIMPKPSLVWYGDDVESYISEMIEVLDPLDAPFPSRWMAIQFIEDNPDLIDKLKPYLPDETFHYRWLEKAVALCNRLGYEDLPTLVAEKRYGFIHGLLQECTTHKAMHRIDWTRKIDAVVTHPFVGLPLFLLLMWGAFQLVFTLGNPLADYLRLGVEWFSSGVGTLLGVWNASPLVASLVTEGVIGGVGSVLVFLPNILILFLIIAFLEDSGYMSRAAFLMDRIMHTMGLHGKSFIPMVLGFGCNVPAIMGTRILESEKDRILTILVIPLISCSARLPIYVLFTGIFFKRHQGLVVVSLYLIGGVLAIFMARIFQRIFFRYETAPLIMELPPYHMPSWRGAFYHMWSRSRLFVQKAGTVIFLGVVAIWALANLPPGVAYASPASWIGRIGAFISPLFAPAGFGFSEASIALLSGVVAKEIVVGTFGSLYGSADLTVALGHHFTALSAYAFMLMSLIYIPCLSTVAVIRREIGTKWALFTVAYTTLLGWIIATAVYQVGSLFF